VVALVKQTDGWKVDVRWWLAGIEQQSSEPRRGTPEYAIRGLTAALAAIDRHGPVTLGALADHEQVAPPSVSRVVAKIEADGLVTRQPDPADRRVTKVALTPKGRALLSASRRRKTEWLTTRLEDLGPEPRARLAEVLDILEALTTDSR